MLNNVIHTPPMSAQRTDPLFWLDSILLVLGAEKFTDGDQAVVPKLETIAGDLPGVDMGVVCWKRWELVVEQAAVYKWDVIPRTIMSQPYIRIEERYRDILKQVPLLCNQILTGVVKNIKDVNFPFPNLLHPTTEDYTEICGEITALQVPS